MIIAPLVVLLVEDPSDAALPRTYKFRCSSEVVAHKVTQLINFAKTVHEYEKTVVQSYRRQMKNTSIFTQPYYSARDEGIGVRGGGEEGGEREGRLGKWWVKRVCWGVEREGGE